MTRITNGIIKQKKRKKILNETKSFRKKASKLYIFAKEQLIQAKSANFKSRKQFKNIIKLSYIKNINFLVKNLNLNYSKFKYILTSNFIFLNYKMLNFILLQNINFLNSLLN